ncbi:unnamed protein product [Caretta caretta]
MLQPINSVVFQGIWDQAFVVNFTIKALDPMILFTVPCVEAARGKVATAGDTPVLELRSSCMLKSRRQILQPYSLEPGIQDQTTPSSSIQEIFKAKRYEGQ